MHGKRIGRDVPITEGVSLPRWATFVGDVPKAPGDSGEGDSESDDDDDDAIPGVGSTRDSTRLVKFIDGLGKDMD